MTRDPEPERQRLAQLYARMTPEELERVADDAASLTELAHEILNTEMARRGLASTSDEPPAARNVMEERDLVAPIPGPAGSSASQRQSRVLRD